MISHAKEKNPRNASFSLKESPNEGKKEEGVYTYLRDINFTEQSKNKVARSSVSVKGRKSCVVRADERAHIIRTK